MTNPKRPAPFQVQGVSEPHKRKFNAFAAAKGLSRPKLLEQMIDALPQPHAE